MSSLITWAVDHVLAGRRRRTEVHLRVHRAYLNVVDGRPLSRPVECYFLNVWNASPETSVQVTHVYVEAIDGSHVAVLTKPLPVTIEPRREWETLVEAVSVPTGTDVERSSRARLSDGSIIESVPRTDVPPAGAIPDG
jgi:hypothetical protein